MGKHAGLFGINSSKLPEPKLGQTTTKGETSHALFLPHPQTRRLQVCIAKALYDVDSIVADPGAYTKEQLASLHSQIVSNLEQASWEIAGGSEDQLTGTMMQISQAVTCPMSSL